MTVSGVPPYSWAYGTDLQGDFFKSVIFCEAMQALTNRAVAKSVAIDNWSAYKHDGSVMQDLGQTPGDADLKTYKAWRHVNHIVQLRTALEEVVGEYYDGGGSPYTISSLLQAAVSRADYNRTTAELQALGYFDGEDVEEILKCVDMLTSISIIVSTEETASWPPLLAAHHTATIAGANPYLENHQTGAYNANYIHAASNLSTGNITNLLATEDGDNLNVLFHAAVADYSTVTGIYAGRVDKDQYYSGGTPYYISKFPVRITANYSVIRPDQMVSAGAYFAAFFWTGTGGRHYMIRVRRTPTQFGVEIWRDDVFIVSDYSADVPTEDPDETTVTIVIG